ncbi:polyprotein [Snowdrop virus Y]|nr:polyprotein [Snowdrop virus Y]
MATNFSSQTFFFGSFESSPLPMFTVDQTTFVVGVAHVEALPAGEPQYYYREGPKLTLQQHLDLVYQAQDDSAFHDHLSQVVVEMVDDYTSAIEKGDAAQAEWAMERMKGHNLLLDNEGQPIQTIPSEYGRAGNIKGNLQLENGMTDVRTEMRTMRKRRNIVAEIKAQREREERTLERFSNEVAAKYKAKREAEFEIYVQEGRRQELRTKYCAHKARRLLRKEDPNGFPEHPTLVDRIYVEADESVGSNTPEPKKRTSTNKRTKRKTKSVKAPKMGPHQLSTFIRALAKIMKSKGGEIRVIEKRETRIRTQRTTFGKKLCAILRHHKGLRMKRDFISGEFTDSVLRDVACVNFNGKKMVNMERVKPGDSGLILPLEDLEGYHSKGRRNTFVVRGRHKGMMYDARSMLSRELTLLITQYSGVAEKFWRGFDKTFLENRTTDCDHVCTSDYDVEECGKVSAIICQAIYPCRRITCKGCAKQYMQATDTDLCKRITSMVGKHCDFLFERHHDFRHMLRFVSRYRMMMECVNTNVDDYMKLESLIGDRTTAPFTHINFVNKVLVKGSLASPTELEQATKRLLEVARHLENRTENIRQGSLHTFRNKISGKAQYNQSLSCDNQLDKNGNFLWGERGRHAKRFFGDKMEEIDMSKGYEHYSLRTVPNGTRKLAITKLIVHINFQNQIENLHGEAVEKFPIISECVSKVDGNYLYACCCVTHDNGAPLHSRFMAPTKGHLVVGNTGDPKYVDLPPRYQDKLYIAKEGYCYVNIFLAMLVNVDENVSKDFTKNVRDNIVVELGQWPLMRDVAAACQLLQTFHPGTEAAELPRILVDHKLKIMHVVDAYGSISSGYHILKANTIGQLINFMYDDVESDMKYYRVGGNVVPTDLSDLEASAIDMDIDIGEFLDQHCPFGLPYNYYESDRHSDWQDMSSDLNNYDLESVTNEVDGNQVKCTARPEEASASCADGDESMPSLETVTSAGAQTEPIPAKPYIVQEATDDEAEESGVQVEYTPTSPRSDGKPKWRKRMQWQKEKPSVTSSDNTEGFVANINDVVTGLDELRKGAANQVIGDVELETCLSFKRLIRAIVRPTEMLSIIQDEPFLLVLSVLSPGIIMAMYNSGSFAKSIEYWVNQDMNVAQVAITLAALAKKVRVCDTLIQQSNYLMASAYQVQESMTRNDKFLKSYLLASLTLDILKARNEADAPYIEMGFASLRNDSMVHIEKNYMQILENSWKELSWLEGCRSYMVRRKWRKNITESLIPKSENAFGSLYDISPMQYYLVFLSGLKGYFRRQKDRCALVINQGKSNLKRKFIGSLHQLIPKEFVFINTLCVLSLLCSFWYYVRAILRSLREAKQFKVEQEERKQWKKMKAIHVKLEKSLGHEPTVDEFLNEIEELAPEILSAVKRLCKENYLDGSDEVYFQAKTKRFIVMERTLAYITLIVSLFDMERGDGVFQILNKFKSLFVSIEDPVRFQSLDDISSELDEKKQTIDFILDGGSNNNPTIPDMNFSDWWDNQLLNSNTITHYRTEGNFLEFTRANAAFIATTIAHSEQQEFLIRGAVGSGKSTGLPSNLCRKGRVLLIEPTRPLVDNVVKNLRGEPFFLKPSMCMRGLTVMGSDPITVMTSGYALHFFANNVEQLKTYSFIMFDECHVLDSCAMAFRCLLHEHAFSGKILKTSATPPGMETELKTQWHVEVRKEESLSFEQFVRGQGTGCNYDVIAKCANILVYVASYNDVDNLSRMLTDSRMKVTKVDGRSMKLGKTDIETLGSIGKPHFIVATNIIENGVTLHIDCVVDFGVKIVAEVDPDLRMVVTQRKAITYGERIQRLGRVGRIQNGLAISVGHTEKGLQEIPTSIATQAAFYSFTYGLPVMAQNVSPSLLGKCTNRQARVMLQFELSPFFMQDYVRFDGTMHKSIFEILKDYRLRTSEVQLNKFALPNAGVIFWRTAKEYNQLGCRYALDEKTRISFSIREVPETVYGKIWKAIQDHRGEIMQCKLTCSQAAKVAYTIKTDANSIPMAINLLQGLLESEYTKQASFNSMVGTSLTSNGFSITNIIQAWKARYASDHTSENIETLTRHIAQLKEFRNLGVDQNAAELIAQYPATQCVQFQNSGEISKHLALKGKWNQELATRDVLLMCGVLAGGAWMIFEAFKHYNSEPVQFQGYNRRNKLRFRNARMHRAHEAAHNESWIGQEFREEFQKKGRAKGKHTASTENKRRFYNIYGFEPGEYSIVRYLDPLTGKTFDTHPLTPMDVIQSHFQNLRREAVLNDEIDAQQTYVNTKIHAYFSNNLTKEALKVDLSDHRPGAIGRGGRVIGFEERRGELRRTGPANIVGASSIPERNGVSDDVLFESKSLFGPIRDFNPISASVCLLTNDSDGHSETMFGIGYGPIIITNQHLFIRNNGALKVRTMHGVYNIENTTQLRVHPIPERDMLLIRLPKDMNPFPQKLKFRIPVKGERVCMVGTNFQEKHASSIVSETATTMPVPGSHFWKHWITTKDGYCGLPLVGTKDGQIIGIHSLTNCNSAQNYLAAFPADFHELLLSSIDDITWTSKWRFNADNISWGSLSIEDSRLEKPFSPSKTVSALEADIVRLQGTCDKWLYDKLHDNLQAVATTNNSLVTKHVVKGKCPMFKLYLEQNDEAMKYFEPMLGFYGPSKLNKDAFVKDILKYSEAITVGLVDTDAFESVIEWITKDMKGAGFDHLEYITDSDTIFKSMNMNAAVGALYTGKKKDYFDESGVNNREEHFIESCHRLHEGKMGIWNGLLKAELRPVEKLEANKTRVFTAAPIDTLLGAKVCVDDFNNLFYSLHTQKPWTVGISKFFGGWDNLLKSLPNDWVYCDADGSQFDSSLTPYLINAVLRIRLASMEEWDIGRKMLENLYTEIVYTPISTPDGTIVKKFRGNNSGQPSTVVDNTLMVIIAMRYSMLTNGIALNAQDEVCKFFANGDDLIIAVRPDMESLLDGLQGKFQHLGLKYTFDSRTRDKSNLWYLSHYGMFKNDMFIPKLEKQRIVSILEWDRAATPADRLSAICAAIIEAWGYDDLIYQVRKFYAWLLEQYPYSILAQEGHAPYLAETALEKLYCGGEAEENEIQIYLKALLDDYELASDECFSVRFQMSGKTIDAGQQGGAPGSSAPPPGNNNPIVRQQDPPQRDRDIISGSHGTFRIPRVKILNNGIRIPLKNGQPVLKYEFLLQYTPNQLQLSNKRASQAQLDEWITRVSEAYQLNEDEMRTVLSGLTVWCIENGTSPKMTGNWVMMEGDEQIEYPLLPIIQFAQPSFRQIMYHFSETAERYILLRNTKEPYMPRYGRLRNLTSHNYAQYAFDFYEITSRTPADAIEVINQMKAAALRGNQNRLFGLDGKVGEAEIDTERHTTEDIDDRRHNLRGAQLM